MPERLTRLGDEFRHRGRAVHRGEDADVVARAGLAVRPHDSPRRSRAAPAAAPRRSWRLRRSDSRARNRASRHCARAPSRRARCGFDAKPMIWPNFGPARSRAIGAIAILWPRGMRSRAPSGPPRSRPARSGRRRRRRCRRGERRMMRGAVMAISFDEARPGAATTASAPGMSVIAISDNSNGISQGRIAMVVRSIDRLAMRASTNSTIPSGGCRSPIIRLSVITTPKWIGSMPTLRITGISTGTRMLMAAIVSRKQPTTSSRRLIMSRMT